MFSTILSGSHITDSVSMLFQSDPTWCFPVNRAQLDFADTGVDINLRTLKNPQVDMVPAPGTRRLPGPCRRTLMAGGSLWTHGWAEADLPLCSLMRPSSLVRILWFFSKLLPPLPLRSIRNRPSPYPLLSKVPSAPESVITWGLRESEGGTNLHKHFHHFLETLSQLDKPGTTQPNCGG